MAAYSFEANSKLITCARLIFGVRTRTYISKKVNYLPYWLFGRKTALISYFPS